VNAGAGVRANQRRRTRKDLLNAAADLMRLGRKPSLEEIAEAAMVSRATAYRYFQNVDALLVEATLDLAAPTPERVFGEDRSGDPVARLERVDAAFDAMMDGNELGLRMMLASALERGVRREGDTEAPVRQNRRTPLIDAALEPVRDTFGPRDLARLKAALALIIGTESMIVFKDVLQLDNRAAKDVKRWAIRALVAAARRNVP